MYGETLLVPAIGTTAYNGITFDAATETTQFSGTPIYDPAGRAIMYTVWTITLRGEVTVDPTLTPLTTDENMDDLRRLLTQPGGRFQYSSKGFGTFDINNPTGTVKDVNWGPKPKLFSYKPIGSALAAEVIWTVEIAVPSHCGSPAHTLRLLAWNYKVGFSKDKSGYNKRTYSGFIQIPQTIAEAGSNKLVDHIDRADAYYEKIIPELPTGFQRIQADRQIHESKCRLDFTVVDEEMPPNVPPPGCISATASHRVESFPRNLLSWTASVDASYELAKDQPRSIAWAHFWKLVQSRTEETLKTRPKVPGVLTPRAFLTNLSMAEPEIYGRQCASFSARYTITSSLAFILAGSGLWKPVGGTWANWKNSLVQTALHPRGNARLSSYLHHDLIVDLCQSGPPSPLYVGTGQGVGTAGFHERGAFEFPRPPRDESWLHYEAQITVEPHDGNVEMKPLAKPQSLTDNFKRNVKSALANFASGNGLQEAKQAFDYVPKKVIQTIQQRTNPSIYIRLTGRALRAGFDIFPPYVVGTNGIESRVVPMNVKGQNGFRSAVVGNLAVPIVAAWWDLRYLVIGIPKDKVKTQLRPTGPREEGKEV